MTIQKGNRTSGKSSVKIYLVATGHKMNEPSLGIAIRATYFFEDEVKRQPIGNVLHGT
jgi:hypothetical protein